MLLGCQLVTVSAVVTEWQRARVRDWTDSTLAERIAYVLEFRKLSLGQLGKDAALSKATISRLRGGQREQGEPKSIHKIATATKVDERWLASGVGQPVVPESIDVDALPVNLRTLVEGSPPGTYSKDELRQAAMYRDLKGRDLTEELWRDYLLSLRREARRMEHELAALRVVHDDPVERRKARKVRAP